MVARAIWKGRIGFDGLEVPVKLYSAVEDRSVHFHLLHDEDHVRVKQRMVNPETDETVEYDAANRGYEIEPGTFVVFSDEEIDDLKPDSSREIEVLGFVESGVLGHRWFDRPYWLGPDGKKGAYFALAEALSKEDAMAVVRWVMRDRHYVGVVMPRSEYLAVTTLRHAGEIIPPDEFEPPAGRDLSKNELELAGKLVSTLEADFDPDEFRDEYRRRLLELIEALRDGGTVDAETVDRPARPEDSLENALRKSLGES